MPERREFDPVTVTATPRTTGNWGSTDYSTFGTFSLQEQQITGTAKKVEKEEHFGSGKDSGYYLCMTFEPWEGTQVRIKRSGSWGKWSTCKDNGDIVFFLGAEDIQATDIEAKSTTGNVTAYTLSITKEE